MFSEKNLYPLSFEVSVALVALLAGIWWVGQLPARVAVLPTFAGPSSVQNSTLRVEGIGDGSSTDAGSQLQSAQSVPQSDATNGGLQAPSVGDKLQPNSGESDFGNSTNNPQ